MKALVLAAQAAARKARAESEKPVTMVGEVLTVSGDLATVAMDGGGTIEALARGKLPSEGDRVEVEFFRGAARIVGLIGGFA